jgi:hypothetical protein
LGDKLNKLDDEVRRVRDGRWWGTSKQWTTKWIKVIRKPSRNLKRLLLKLDLWKVESPKGSAVAETLIYPWFNNMTILFDPRPCLTKGWIVKM